MTRVILMAATPRDGAGQAVPVRLQGGGRYPAQFQGEAWLPVLTDWPDLLQALPFDGLTFGGGSAANIGQVRFALNGGRFAWLTELVWTRAPVTFHIGEDGDDASFTVLWRGRARSLAADDTGAELTLADPALVLERALLTGRYAGTGGAEGDASVQGVLKRLAWGQPNNVGLTLIEKANLIYASVDQAVVFRGIKQGGLSQTVSGDVASLAALRAAAIPAGMVATCAALGLVRPAAEPTYPLTADLTIAGPRTPAALAGTLAARAGLAFAAGQIAAFDSFGQEIDLVVSDDLTVRQALDQIFAPLGAWWRLNAAGELECGRYLDPAAATVSLPGHLTLSYRRLATQPPVWRSVIGHDVNWRPLADGEIAGIIRAAEVDGLGALATQDGVDWNTQVGGDGKPQDNATVGAPAGTLVGSIPAEWLHLGASNDIIHEDFTSYTDVSEIEPDVWLRRTGSGEISLSGSALYSGGRALQCGNNSGDDEVWITTGRSIPYDPDAVYLVTATVFRQSGNGTVYIGVEGRALDGVNLVNRFGLNEVSNQHYSAASGVVPPVGQLVTYTGYLKGYSAAPGYSGDIAAPGTVHPDVRRIAPLAVLNYNSVPGVSYLDSITLQRLTDGYAETVVQAAEATDRLIKIGSDSLIAQEEKAAFIREVNALLTLADQTIIAATNVGLGAGNPSANWASAVTVRKNSLTSLLAGYTTPSLWSDTTGDTNVNAVNLEYAIAELNSYIAQAQAAISTRASTTANWSGVNNDTGGKPEDFATNDRGVDTRYDNFLPSYYRTNWLQRWRMEFKLSATIGAPSNYGDLHTYAGWQDDNGGPVIQRYETSSGTYWRRGTNASGWGAWAKSFDELNRPDFASSDILSGGVALRPGDVRNDAIVLSSDGALSFNSGFGVFHLGSILISQVPGKISTTQIADNAITTPLLAANVVTGDKLAANDLITLTAQIGIGVIQAANIGSLSASVINAGLLDARRLSLDGATIEPDASGVLRVKNAGVGTDQLAAGALVQPVSINAIGTQNLTQNGWATAYLSGSFVQLTVNNAAAYPGIVKLDVTAYLYQSGSGSDEVTMRVYYSGANVGSVGPMDVSGGSTRLNSIPATFMDSVPANTTRTYFIEFYSNDQTVLRQITASAQLFKRT